MKQLKNFVIPLGVVGILLMFFVPVSPVLLDILIAVNISVSLVVLVTAMYIRRPLEFAAFPSMLLILTLFRLSLNLVSTRLVLSDGYAGKTIHTFGHMIINGDLIIGMVIFLVLACVQLMVITKGAERVSEVGARFALDKMPGKQMSIDAAVNSGNISEEEAARRRKEVDNEADFFGAMDGAAKFVKGDAMIALLVTFVNLIGGMLIGLLRNGMSFSEAIETYSLLTIGDGLVTQIPALMMSFATGLVVTRNANDEDLGTTVGLQLTQSRPALLIGAGAAVLIALIPGMPVLPFLGAAVIAVLIAQNVKRNALLAEISEEERAQVELINPANPDSPDNIAAQLYLPDIEVVLARDLASLIDSPHRLTDRIKNLRVNKIAPEWGFVVPKVRTRDGALPLNTYAINLRGVEVARGVLPTGKVLALRGELDLLAGDVTLDPVFGLPSKWIDESMQSTAELYNSTVCSRVLVLTTHLSQVVVNNAHMLLTVDMVKSLMDGLSDENSLVVEELVPTLLSYSQVQQVLRELLRDRISIRDLPGILGGLLIQARKSTDLPQLVEAARAEIAPSLAERFSMDGIIRFSTINPVTLQRFSEKLQMTDGGIDLALAPEEMDQLGADLRELKSLYASQGRELLLAVPKQIRPAMSRILSINNIGGAALSIEELGQAKSALVPEQEIHLV